MCAQFSGYEQNIIPGMSILSTVPALAPLSTVPPLAPIPTFPDGFSRKRPAEDGANGPGPAAKRPAKCPDVVFRLLVPAGKIGKVIGKQGNQIKLLREETTAFIKIADAVTSMEDRVVLISSKEEPFTTKTVAEIALLRVATVLLEEIDGSATTAAIGPQHQVAANLTRLLIAGSQAGSLIGKGGSTIQDIRDSSAANVRILPSDQLPICSSACETDRLVQISGEVSQVQNALELIAAKLRENPPKESITVNKPAYFIGINPSGQQVLLPQSALTYTLPSAGNVSRFQQQLMAQSMMAYGSLPSPNAALSLYGGSIGMQPKVTAEMSIPSVFMGGVIGRGGSNITQIRSISGASIKVHGPKEGVSERTIYFEGTEEQVATAQNLVQAALANQ